MRNAESNTFHDTLTSYVLIANGVCIISTVKTNKATGDKERQRLDFLLSVISSPLPSPFLSVLDFILKSHNDFTTSENIAGATMAYYR